MEPYVFTVKVQIDANNGANARDIAQGIEEHMLSHPYVDAMACSPPAPAHLSRAEDPNERITH